MWRFDPLFWIALILMVYISYQIDRNNKRREAVRPLTTSTRTIRRLDDDKRSE